MRDAAALLRRLATIASAVAAAAIDAVERMSGGPVAQPVPVRVRPRRAPHR